MSKQAYTRLQARRKTVGESEPESGLFQHSTSFDHDAISQAPAHAASAQLSNEDANHMGHDFGQIAIQPAPTATLQMKRRVSQPGDSHEQEADEVAEQVMRMPNPAATPSATTAPSGGDVATQTAPASSGGQPLDTATRAFMEPRFGHDFGQVRVHTDEQAAEQAAGVSARAFTVGSDIVFGAREYAPDTLAGQHLLAHELTHVVQQESDTTAAATVQREPEGAAGPMALPKDLSDVAGNAAVASTGAANMDDDTIAISIMGAQLAILDGWKTALDNFIQVMESKADKEANPDIFKAVGKFFGEEGLGKVGEYFGVVVKVGEVVINPLDEGYKALKAFTEEAARMKEAEESATLRDFYTRHNTAIGKMRAAVDKGTGMFLQIVRNTSDAMMKTIDTKKGAAVEALSRAADNYTTMRMALDSAYTEIQSHAAASTPENIFRVLTEEWIRNSTVSGGWGIHHGKIVVRLNKDFSVKDAHIQASGGQKLAEQLVKEAQATNQDGVDVYNMGVKKEVQYYGDEGGYPSAYVYLDEENHIYNAVKGDEGTVAVWEYIRSYGAKALIAKKVDGD